MTTVVIPAYEMYGKGRYFLDRALRSIPPGTDVVISFDCDIFPELQPDAYGLHLTMIQNKRTPGTSGNLNNALNHAKGDLIKVLFQDDELGSLAGFDTIKQWGFCTSIHNTERGDHIPYHPPGIKELSEGCNTYGSPTAMAFRNTDIRFDERLRWLLDCDFYAQMTMRYGLPDLVPGNVYITEWEGQATKRVAHGQLRLTEQNLMKIKYANL